MPPRDVTKNLGKETIMKVKGKGKAAKGNIQLDSAVDKLAYVDIADLFKTGGLLGALSVPTEPQSNLQSKLSHQHCPNTPNCGPKDSATFTCPFSRVSKIMLRPLSWVRDGLSLT